MDRRRLKTRGLQYPWQGINILEGQKKPDPSFSFHRELSTGEHTVDYSVEQKEIRLKQSSLIMSVLGLFVSGHALTF